jgi:peroxisomal membrane protein 2
MDAAPPSPPPRALPPPPPSGARAGAAVPDVVVLALRRYLALLERRPLRTKAATAAAVAALGDVLSQRLARAPRWDWRRTAALTAFGAAWTGPSGHYWQRALERAFPPPRRGQPDDPLRPLKRAALDQLTYGPLCNLLFLLWFAHAVERRPWAALRAKAAAEFPAVQARGWRVWPAASLAGQLFVPLELRVLWMNLVGLGWGAWLSSRAAAARPAPIPAASYAAYIARVAVVRAS